MKKQIILHALVLPVLVVFFSFFLLPMAKLFSISLSGASGAGIYWEVLRNPRYFGSLRETALLSLGVTAAALFLGGLSGIFLERHRFRGREVMISALTLPLSFPGVVVGFMVILWAGRLGIFGSLTNFLFGKKLVFAYGAAGLFVGYLYFSIPRVVITVMAAAGKLEKATEEAARTLGAGPFGAARDVAIPLLLPSFLSTGAICFATSMGAFGTAFTLATDINVLPVIIYTEFTLSANLAVAGALSLILGFLTWAALFATRVLSGIEPAGSGA
ncbi:MAG: ABC transporter permease [Deltaproteobacteria bacterium]|jgi:putative spermidine/putrescine transport system permease protein|nr:ABC transporter permease [Deltaproteobacteria bacterium]